MDKDYIEKSFSKVNLTVGLVQDINDLIKEYDNPDMGRPTAEDTIDQIKKLLLEYSAGIIDINMEMGK